MKIRKCIGFNSSSSRPRGLVGIAAFLTSLTAYWAHYPSHEGGFKGGSQGGASRIQGGAPRACFMERLKEGLYGAV